MRALAQPGRRARIRYAPAVDDAVGADEPAGITGEHCVGRGADVADLGPALADEDDAFGRLAVPDEDLAEILVLRQQHAARARGNGGHVPVCRAPLAFGQVDDVVASAAQVLDDAAVEALVGKKPHRAAQAAAGSPNTTSSFPM